MVDVYVSVFNVGMIKVSIKLNLLIYLTAVGLVFCYGCELSHTCRVTSTDILCLTACGKNRKADVIFVYNSATMSSRDVTKVRRFVNETVHEFNFGTGNIRVGTVSQACQPGDIDLGKVSTLSLSSVN